MVELARCPAPLGAPDHESPSREEVTERLAAVNEAVASCFSEKGVAHIGMDIEGATGTVSTLAVLSGPTENKECIGRAFSQVCFKPFTKPQVMVSFPFRVGPGW